MTTWLLQPSQPLCTSTEPTPSAGQDPTLPRAWWPPGKSAGPTCFTPGNFTWSSCNHLFCAKLKQCVVLACCILYKNPFPPTHCLKHLYKFYLNRKLEILFTICFSPKRASKINSQTLQEDINLTLIFFSLKKKKKEKKKSILQLSFPSAYQQGLKVVSSNCWKRWWEGGRTGKENQSLCSKLNACEM